jgi:hypothetical protein
MVQLIRPEKGNPDVFSPAKRNKKTLNSFYNSSSLAGGTPLFVFWLGFLNRGPISFSPTLKIP